MGVTSGSLVLGMAATPSWERQEGTDALLPSITAVARVMASLWDHGSGWPPWALLGLSMLVLCMVCAHVIDLAVRRAGGHRDLLYGARQRAVISRGKIRRAGP